MAPRICRFVVCAIVLGVVASSGCSSIPIAYPEPRRVAAEVARIRASRGKILSVDGVERFDSIVELLPGEHEIDVTYLLRYEEFAPNVREEDVARIDCRCKMILLAGGRYRLELARSTAVERRSGLVTRYVHGPQLRDERDGRKLFLDSICKWR